MLAATLLALSSAVLHATWNLVVKTSEDRDLAAWGQFLFGGLLVIPLLFVVGWPDREVYPYLVASSLVQVGYVIGLVKAYTHGDFSLTYPLARGGGAFLAALGGVAFLSDQISQRAWFAIALVAVGLASLVRRDTHLPSIGWAALTALMICVYTLIDSRGSRLSQSGASYGLATTLFPAVTVSATNLLRGRGPAFVASIRPMWPRYLGAGVCLAGAYTLVMIAVKQAPVGYVAMLRESSIVIGALAGWVLLHETFGKHRMISSLVIVSGLVMLVVFAV